MLFDKTLAPFDSHLLKCPSGRIRCHVTHKKTTCVVPAGIQEPCFACHVRSCDWDRPTKPKYRRRWTSIPDEAICTGTSPPDRGPRLASKHQSGTIIYPRAYTADSISYLPGCAPRGIYRSADFGAVYYRPSKSCFDSKIELTPLARTRPPSQSRSPKSTRQCPLRLVTIQDSYP
ncbi:hypothetical protein BC834DRAFT_622102 [Gloeopeniophorella convolvens]|nr:hypothetical protein BC834DRAFT_622102 [Gloeopeniophorella convolvens]